VNLMQPNSPRALLMLALLTFCRMAGSQEKKPSDVPSAEMVLRWQGACCQPVPERCL